MSVMVTAVAPPARVLTRADLDALPDDGLRHELIDGAFFMTPSPTWEHQTMVIELIRVLRAATKDDLLLLTAPADVVFGANVLVPDLFIVKRSDLAHRDQAVPLLVVEVRSPSTGWVDTGRKREIYQASGVEHYWLADPGKPSLTLLRLVDGYYRTVATLVGGQELTISEPVPVRLNPSQLVLG